MRRLVCACVVRKPPEDSFSRVEALIVAPSFGVVAPNKDTDFILILLFILYRAVTFKKNMKIQVFFKVLECDCILRTFQERLSYPYTFKACASLVLVF